MTVTFMNMPLPQRRYNLRRAYHKINGSCSYISRDHRTDYAIE